MNWELLTLRFNFQLIQDLIIELLETAFQLNIGIIKQRIFMIHTVFLWVPLALSQVIRLEG